MTRRAVPKRNGLPPERTGLTRKMRLGPPEAELNCYATLSFYPDGAPGELILYASKQGSLERGLLHCLGVVVSVALQHGVPPEKLTDKLKGVAFSPDGLTGAKDIPMVSSIADYVAKWMDLKLAPKEAPADAQ